MTKQEKIKEAYEEIGLPFNENVIYDNGWLKIKPTQYSSKYDLVDLLKLTSHVHSIRPKSLSGIENNNGWNKIESDSDLPKDEGQYWVHNEKMKQTVYSQFDFELKFRFGLGHTFPATHYQPITKPKPPIY